MHIFAWLLLHIAGSLVARVLFSLGMSFVVYQGLDTLQTYIVAQLNSLTGALPADAAALVAKMGLFNALSIVVSAYLASLSLIAAMVGAKRLIAQPAS